MNETELENKILEAIKVKREIPKNFHDLIGGCNYTAKKSRL